MLARGKTRRNPKWPYAAFSAAYSAPNGGDTAIIKAHSRQIHLNFKESPMNKKAIVISPRALYVCAPAFDAEADDEGWYGHIVTCTQKLDGGWYKIITPYRYETYAHKDDLLFDAKEVKRAESEDTKLMRVWALAGDVHTEGKHNGNVILTLYRGAIVERIDDENAPNGWTHVRLYGGTEGFMRSTQLGAYYSKPALGEEELRNAVCSLARQYLGTQYRWGGKTPLGIDCSGLVGSCYLMYGVDMYRNADIVEGFCVHEIERKDIKKGDMLFFKGHVAMYLGEGRYIHSTSKAGSDGVVINSLSPCDPDYREDLANGVIAVGSVF